MFCQSFFYFKFDNSHFGNLQITLEINIIVQAKVNRELASLGADLTSIDMNKGYITCSKSKASSVMHGAKENNVLPLQTITSGDNDEALAGAATTLSLPSPSMDSSTS